MINARRNIQQKADGGDISMVRRRIAKEEKDLDSINRRINGVVAGN